MTFRDLPFSRVVFMAVGSVLALSADGTAYAQVKSYSDGVIRAVSYKEISDRISIRVELYDNADLDLLIHSRIIDALRRANHTIDVNPMFELSFSTHFHTAHFREREPTLGELSVGRGVRLEMNIWSSTRDSVLTGRQAGSGYTGHADFEIHATLRELSLGKVVWAGHVTAFVDRRDAETVMPSMVDVLVMNLGSTVDERWFPLN
ncbi:MAG TPA: hypothetical protein VGA50_16405 [Kiloniellales bacterium]